MLNEGTVKSLPPRCFRLLSEPCRKSTCSILTTTPNAVTSAVHDRMPVILDPDNYEVWLDPGMKDVSTASELLRPCDARLMRCYLVSTRINHVANDDEECSRPVEFAQIQNRLFF
jgi:putative SOS response-associated peptidase YedK